MTELALASMAAAVAALDTDAIRHSLDHEGCFGSGTLIDAAGCEAIAGLYEDPARFRSTVTMARHGFGRGEYKYFGRPLPPIVATLRARVYAKLAPLANAWALRLRHAAHWPDEHAELVARCGAAGQTLPTPLLLRYGPGDYNCGVSHVRSGLRRTLGLIFHDAAP